MLIEVKKRYLINLVIITSLVLGLILVYAYGTSSPSTFGHSGGELDISVSPTVGGTPETKTIQDAVDNGYLGDRMTIFKVQNQPLIDATYMNVPNQWYIPATLPGPIPLNAKFAILYYQIEVSGLVAGVAGKTTCPSLVLSWSKSPPQSALGGDAQAYLYDNGVGPATGGHLTGKGEQIIVPLIPGTGTYSFKWAPTGPANPDYKCDYMIHLEGYII